MLIFKRKPNKEVCYTGRANYRKPSKRTRGAAFPEQLQWDALLYRTGDFRVKLCDDYSSIIECPICSNHLHIDHGELVHCRRCDKWVESWGNALFVGGLKKLWREECVCPTCGICPTCGRKVR